MFLLSPSTRGRDRTGTSITSSVFETDASTNSATRAHSFYEHFFEGAKVVIFFKYKSCIFATKYIMILCPGSLKMQICG